MKIRPGSLNHHYTWFHICQPCQVYINTDKCSQHKILTHMLINSFNSHNQSINNSSVSYFPKYLSNLSIFSTSTAPRSSTTSSRLTSQLPWAHPCTLHVIANRRVSRMNSIRPCPQFHFLSMLPLHVEQNTNSWTGQTLCSGLPPPPAGSPASFQPLSLHALTSLHTHWTSLCCLTTNFLPQSFHIHCSLWLECSDPLLDLQNSAQCHPLEDSSHQHCRAVLRLHHPPLAIISQTGWPFSPPHAGKWAATGTHMLSCLTPSAQWVCGSHLCIPPPTVPGAVETLLLYLLNSRMSFDPIKQMELDLGKILRSGVNL